MTKRLIYLFLFIFSISESEAQITLINSFNPTSVGGLCGIGFDPTQQQLWVYDCSSDSISCLSLTGNLLYQYEAPGEGANDMDIEIAATTFSFAGSTVTPGQILFVNGETGTADIYAIDKSTGLVTDSLITDFGVSHVVGGSYHPPRNTFFLVQDNVPAAVEKNKIAEINPLNGDTINTFYTTGYFNISYGDIEVSTSGSLFLVSSDENDSIAEINPNGTLIQKYALPIGVDNLSGIALDCDNNEAWVVNTSGVVYHLGQFPCGTVGLTEFTETSITISPNPSQSVFNFSKVIDNFKIYNQIGELIIHHPGYTNSIDLSNYSKGIYFIVMESGEAIKLSRY